MVSENMLLNLLNNFGFPVFVTAILLYDKMKTNGALKQVVMNNNELLRQIQQKMGC